MVTLNYRNRGYLPSGPGELHFTQYHALPDTQVFVALHEDRVVATLSLVFDNSLLGLPIDGAGQNRLIIGIVGNAAGNVRLAGHDDGVNGEKGQQPADVVLGDVVFASNAVVAESRCDLGHDRRRDDQQETVSAPGIDRLRRQSLAYQRAADEKVCVEDGTQHEA